MVTLDLKSFGSKYVLWIVDSFCRFVQGKVILYKKADMIVNALTDNLIMCFGIPNVGFYANNGEEFVNVKVDELMARLGVTVRYGPAYSPWFN